MEEIELDEKELQKLLQVAARPGTRDLLSRELLRVQELKQKMPQPSAAAPKDRSEPVFQELARYAWADDGANVKLYIPLTNVAALPTDAIKTEFSSRSFDIRVYGYQDKNLRLAIPRLFGQIDTAKSAVTVKPNDIVVRFAKKDAQTWTKLTGVEEEPSSSKDPGKDLMGLMRKMYDEGDDNMKRTMAEAFTKAQNERRL